MKKIKKDMGFLDHLEELRWHLIRGVIAIFVLGALSFIFNDYVMDIVFAPKSSTFITNILFCELSEKAKFINICINQKNFSLVNLEMSGQFMMSIKIAIIVGITLGFPYLLFEFWKFFKPALHENEKKHSSGIITCASLLFVLGVLFGYYLLAPISINFFFNYNLGSDGNELVNNIKIQSYIDLLSSIILGCGIAFELPLIIFFLSKLGLVSSKNLKKYRRHALLGILVMSAIITPPDIFSQVLISIPLLILYEMGIMVAIRTEKKQIIHS